MSEMPRYKATRSLSPVSKRRFMVEPPFSQAFSADEYQYSDKFIAAGEEIATRSWPHPSMVGLDETADRILRFFKSAMRSRLPVGPFHNGKLRLESGFENAPDVQAAPRLHAEPMDLRPVK